MENAAVHRLVEQHAAAQGDKTAIVCESGNTSYRDLNFKANAIARRLVEAGFCRGAHARITMTPGVDLAAVLLAVLKAGGSYSWVGSAGSQPALAIANKVGDAPLRYRPLDVATLLADSERPSPNLPILIRPGDIACVLADEIEPRPILVPHATIAALRSRATASQPHAWEGDRTTFDLWSGLLAGATLSVATAPALMNAA